MKNRTIFFMLFSITCSTSQFIIASAAQQAGAGAGALVVSPSATDLNTSVRLLCSAVMLNNDDSDTYDHWTSPVKTPDKKQKDDSDNDSAQLLFVLPEPDTDPKASPVKITPPSSPTKNAVGTGCGYPQSPFLQDNV